MATDKSAKNEEAREAALGILFIHGIGEQERGDTLLEFADPFVNWLSRWGDTVGEVFEVTSVSGEQDAPVTALLTSHATGAKARSDDHERRILLAESWWAGKFRPPAVFELSWWLLLIGTWATISHAAKPLVNAVTCTNRRFLGPWHWTVAAFRATFFYTPLALTYQVAVVALALLGAIPVGPWRSLISDVLLKLSRTLGDSYVLIHSPIQRRFVIDAVRRDILAMLERCDRVMIVAHSQGAAITYYALEQLRTGTGDGEVREGALNFVSVGSGLDKLDELSSLNARLSYRKRDHFKRWQSRVFYLLPIAFVGFWSAALIWWLAHPAAALFAAAGLLLGIWIFAIVVIARAQRRFAVDVAQWHDILATSDPVSNGPIRGPDVSHVIVNERSLLKDHTTYFTNGTDFAPLLLRLVANFSKLSWLRRANEESGVMQRRSRRDVRKQCLIIGKWLNRLGGVAYLVLREASFSSFWERLYCDALSIVMLKFQALSWPEMIWLHALLIYGGVEILLRWSDRTNDRTETNWLFSGDRFLWYVRAILTVLPIAISLVAWCAFCYPLAQ